MVQSISEAELTRIFSVRTQPEFMLFLGAGASSTSGIPTASEMIWLFKREIFCSERNISRDSFKDLSVDAIRKPIQEYIEQQSWYKNISVEDEYSTLFEKTWREERDRRLFIQRYVREASPSIGYKCLGKLLDARKVVNVLTTNFDDLVEKSLPPESTTSFFVISPESENRLDDTQLMPSFHQLFKLHGDFRYDRLQNTTQELQDLNKKIQIRLLDFFREYGVIFVGYSGRDQSVMEMLKTAIDDQQCFRKGLYWCLIPEEEPSQGVLELVESLRHNGRPADFVRVDSFDELLFHLYRQCSLRCDNIDRIAEERFEQRALFIYSSGRNTSNEIIKLNAIRIREYPTTLFQFETDLRDWEQLRTLTEGQKIIAVLYKDTVLAIGNRSLIETVFEGHISDSIFIFSILPEHLRRNRGFVYHMYYQAFRSFLIEDKSLCALGRKIFYVLPESSVRYTLINSQSNRTIEINLSEEINNRNTICYVHPAFSYQLRFHDKYLYFVLKPEVVLTSNGRDLLMSPNKMIICNDIVSKRYNRDVHNYLLFWLDYLSDGDGNIEFTYPPGMLPTVAKFSLESHYSYSCLETQ